MRSSKKRRDSYADYLLLFDLSSSGCEAPLRNPYERSNKRGRPKRPPFINEDSILFGLLSQLQVFLSCAVVARVAVAGAADTRGAENDRVIRAVGLAV